ncbi:hypothetical protein MNR01_01220 [Lysobacter sp. S4-A87]|uniref:hypothetical protein n=1 Tax=Lysobacter sp. S4-A87 TaxID=2925843 RepID=UPI001F53686F|nr:hypothetical protein [Lysobacter sp. S4-A87]UNK49690.1 hypothetical protein MNR01_01220 [Lysobacter sp. S4-A87]
MRNVLPTGARLAWSRSIIEKGFAKDITAAYKVKDYEGVRGLEEQRNFELTLQREEEDAHYTQRLLRQARRLRVPIPRIHDEDGIDSDHWYVGSETGRYYLTEAGIGPLREEIRRELKARHESRAQLVVWVSAVTGAIGAITGLVAVLHSGLR